MQAVSECPGAARLVFFNLNTSFKFNTSLAEPGHSLTACNAAPPAKPKMATRGPKMADGVWKGVLP